MSPFRSLGMAEVTKSRRKGKEWPRIVNWLHFKVLQTFSSLTGPWTVGSTSPSQPNNIQLGCVRVTLSEPAGLAPVLQMWPHRTTPFLSSPCSSFWAHSCPSKTHEHACAHLHTCFEDKDGLGRATWSTCVNYRIVRDGARLPDSFGNNNFIKLDFAQNYRKGKTGWRVKEWKGTEFLKIM